LGEFVAKHLFERRSYYEQAKLSVKIDNKTKKEVTEEIQNLLN
jgi:shikimate kinase